MQPIRTAKSARINALQMYRDDLDHLLSLFKEHCATVVLSDDKYRYDSLEEIKVAFGTNIKQLEIHGDHPSLHFRLNRIELDNSSPPSRIWFNELRSDEATDEADILFFRVRDYLTDRQMPRFRWLYLVLSVLTLALAIARTVYVYAVYRQPNTIPLSAGAGFLACIVLFVFSFQSKNRISLETRANAASFWVKYKDDFLKHAITTTVGATIGGLIGYLIGRLGK